MVKKSQNIYPIIGICDSCKKRKLLENFSGLKLCHECEEIFFEPLEKLHKDQEYGQDIMRDEKSKKGDQ